MRTVLIAPRKYIQGRGVLAELGECAKTLGAKPLVLWDACVKEILGEAVQRSMQSAAVDWIDVEFNGEATAGPGQQRAS